MQLYLGDGGHSGTGTGPKTRLGTGSICGGLSAGESQSQGRNPGVLTPKPYSFLYILLLLEKEKRKKFPLIEYPLCARNLTCVYSILTTTMKRYIGR